MMQIVIIEDEKPAQERLKKMIMAEVPDAEIIAVLDSVKSSVRWLEAHTHPDLFFMDIQLADGLSFSIFDQISTEKPVIFCTAYDEYALKAFKLNSVDYLLKPIHPDELNKALHKFKNYHHKKAEGIDMAALQKMLSNKQDVFKKRFMIKVGDKIQSIATEEIAFLWSEHKATYLQTKEKKKFIIDYTLDEVQDLINPEMFFRLNRKYISSLDAIKEVYSYSNSRLKILLTDCSDSDILISREKVNNFKQWLDS